MGGMEMMAERVIKNLVANLPPEVSEKIGQIFQTVITFDNRIAELDRKLDVLLLIAGYTAPAQQKELSDGRPGHADPQPEQPEHRSE